MQLLLVLGHRAVAHRSEQRVVRCIEGVELRVGQHLVDVVVAVDHSATTFVQMLELAGDVLLHPVVDVLGTVNDHSVVQAELADGEANDVHQLGHRHTIAAAHQS